MRDYHHLHFTDEETRKLTLANMVSSGGEGSPESKNPELMISGTVLNGLTALHKMYTLRKAYVSPISV